MKKRFTGLWVPAPILLSDFNSTERFILAEIAVMEKSDGCFAGNAHLGKIGGIKPRAVRYVLASLSEAGAIVIENKGSKRRRLRLGADLKRQIAELDAESGENLDRRARRTRQTTAVSSDDGRQNIAASEDGERQQVARLSGNTVPPEEASHCRPTRQPNATENTVRTQDKNTNENTNTAMVGVGLPEWVPTPVWDMWLAYNQENRRKVTATTQSLQIEKLAELRAQGHEPAKVIKQSIEKGWRSLCELPKPSASRPSQSGHICATDLPYVRYRPPRGAA